MLSTLFLPIVIPYGEPWSAFNPKAHYLRKVEFLRWIESVEKNYNKYNHVPLLFTEYIEKHETTFIVGDQEPQTNYVPSGTGG